MSACDYCWRWTAEGGEKNKKPEGLDLDQCAKIRNPNPLKSFAGYSPSCGLGY